MELEPLEDSGTQENFRVKVGSDVLVDNDEFDHDWIVRVTELFEDRSDKEVDVSNVFGRRVLMACRCVQAPGRFRGRWFYRIEDTLVMVTRNDGTLELPLDNNIGRR